jgi:hypothetical protein
MSGKIITRVRQRAIDQEARRQAHELDLQWREIMESHRRRLLMHCSPPPQTPRLMRSLLSLLGLLDAPRDGVGSA